MTDGNERVIYDLDQAIKLARDGYRTLIILKSEERFKDIAANLKIRVAHDDLKSMVVNVGWRCVASWPHEGQVVVAFYDKVDWDQYKGYEWHARQSDYHASILAPYIRAPMAEAY
jgi:hypothetical protein